MHRMDNHPRARRRRAAANLCIALLVVFAAGCADVMDPPATPSPALTPTPSIMPTFTSEPTLTPTPTPSPTPTPTPLPTPMALVVSVLAENKVKLHREPDTLTEVVGELDPGVFVPLIEMTDDGLWLKIGLDAVGWVSGMEVSLSGDILAGNTTAPRRQALLQADTPVNVRSGPGTRNKVLGRLKSGQVVPVLGRNDDGSWLKIPFGGGEGWVSAETVIVAGGDPTPTPQVTEEITREP